MSTNRILRYIIFVGLFLIPFLAFIVSASMLFPFITGKNFAFRIITEIIFAAWLILMLRDKEYRPKFSWLLIAVTAFTVLIGIADLFAENPAKALWSNYERMEGFITIFHLFLYFIVAGSVLHTQKLWNYIWYTWIGSSVIMCIYGTRQLLGQIPINQGGVRVDGTLGNATYLAVYLLFNIFFTLFVYLRSKDKKKIAWILGPVFLYQLVILYYTATRGAILGLIGGLFVMALVIALFEKKQRTLKRIALGAIVATVVFIGGFILVRNTHFVQTSPVLSRFASLSFSDLQTQGRFYIWPMAIQGFIERPILGWGQEGFSYVFNEHYNPEMFNQEQWFDRAHSILLDWLIAGGLVGLLSYLSILFFAFWYLWKSKNQDFSLAEKGLLTGLLAAYIFQGIFVFDNLVSYLLLFSFLAMIHAMNGGNHIKIPEALHLKTGQSIVATLVALVLVFSIYFFNWKPIRASQNLISALSVLQDQGNPATALDFFEKALSYNTFGNPEIREQLANSASNFLTPQGVPDDVKNNYVALTRAEFDKQIKETPNDARYYLFYGTFLRSIGLNDEALTNFKKALALSPAKQTISMEIGATLIQEKKYTEAITYLKSAYDAEPAFLDAEVYYAIGALYLNDTTLANSLFAKIPDNTLINDPRVIQALAQTGRYPELVQIFTRRIAGGDDSISNNISLAAAYYESGNSTQAIAVLKRYEQKDPTTKAQLDTYIQEIQSGKVQ